jgi:hypothetical protein
LNFGMSGAEFHEIKDGGLGVANGAGVFQTDWFCHVARDFICFSHSRCRDGCNSHAKARRISAF